MREDALKVRDALHRARTSGGAHAHSANWLHHVAQHFATTHAVRFPRSAGRAGH